MSGRPDISLEAQDLETDPMVQFRRWYEDAEGEGIHMPNAIALATADAQGVPAVRHVLLRGFDERGFAFYTNYSSRKARHLDVNPHAAFTILWKELDRQVCVTGTVQRTSKEESEAYFATRPRDAKLGAWASRQSQVIASRAELMARFTQAGDRYTGQDVPLPPFWGGYRLDPDSVEFWQGRAFRLHDRLRYSRLDGAWKLERLSP